MHQKLNERVVDLNPQETAEWVESLDQVIDQAGPDRAAFLLEHLNDRARANGAELPDALQYPVYQHHPGRRRGSPTPATAPWSGASRA